MTPLDEMALLIYYFGPMAEAIGSVGNNRLGKR